MLYRRLIVWCAAVGISLVLSSSASADDPTPLAKKHKDGFPTGNATSEGAATDLVRAYIGRDFLLFNKVRYVRMCETPNDHANKYVRFLRYTAFSNNSKTYKLDSLPSELTRISKVFTARSLAPQNEEEKAEWELRLLLHHLQDQMFVDVIAEGSDGREYLQRAVVDQHIGGGWTAQLPIHHAYPHPHTHILFVSVKTCSRLTHRPRLNSRKRAHLIGKMPNNKSVHTELRATSILNSTSLAATR